ncbi:GIY-YIG nuclease family protein [Ekhidna sp.]|uniref:GIY-YIG nuclease family protein n=1 Tax=Ekhidna sp. TaxID=2608089 RepID=UPI0032F04929
MGNFFVYITTNPRKSVLYTGMTNSLEQRLVEHFLNRGNQKTFAGKYYCYFLIHYERLPTPSKAIEREKEIKAMSRAQKIKLIETENPKWHFLNKSIMDWPPDPEITSR